MKSNLDSIFKTDQTVERGGIWFTISDETGFLVRRFGGFNSQQLKKKMAKHFKPYSAQIDADKLDPDKEHELMARVFVEACLIDWKGVEIEGVDTPFSVEAAVELFKSLPELFKALVEYATDFKNYREELGNS